MAANHAWGPQMTGEGRAPVAKCICYDAFVRVLEKKQLTSFKCVRMCSCRNLSKIRSRANDERQLQNL